MTESTKSFLKDWALFAVLIVFMILSVPSIPASAMPVFWTGIFAWVASTVAIYTICFTEKPLKALLPVKQIQTGSWVVISGMLANYSSWLWGIYTALMLLSLLAVYKLMQNEDAMEEYMVKAKYQLFPEFQNRWITLFRIKAKTAGLELIKTNKIYKFIKENDLNDGTLASRWKHHFEIRVHADDTGAIVRITYKYPRVLSCHELMVLFPSKEHALVWATKKIEEIKAEGFENEEDTINIPTYDVYPEATELVAKALCGNIVALYTENKFFSIHVQDMTIETKWGKRSMSDPDVTKRSVICENKRELGDRVRMMVEDKLTKGYKEKHTEV